MPTVLDAPAESHAGALPLQTTPAARLAPFSVERYHQLIASGHFTAEDQFELLEGYLVTKMSKTTPREGTPHILIKQLIAVRGSEWDRRVSGSIMLARSEPEPDIAIVRPDANSYRTRHPEPADIGVVVEVSDSSLTTDRGDKLWIFARAGIPKYWIVNLIDNQIEVCERPLGTDYQTRPAYLPGENVPVVLAGRTAGQIAVDAVLPKVRLRGGESFAP